MASATYVDLLDATAGSAITVSITKAAGTDLSVFGCVSAISTGGGTTITTVGVNDGTTDTDICRAQLETTAYGTISGAIILTGLGAGTFTLKLRVKRTGNTFNFNSGASSATITVSEIDARLNQNAASALHGSVFSTTSTTYVDLLSSSGGSTIAVAITKGAGTSLLVRGSTACVEATTSTVTLGVNDGTNDTDLARQRIFTTANSPFSGERVIAGLGAGTFTLKLRVKVSAANSAQWTANSVSSSITVTEIAP